MIPEKEREALMRLTMCAREECSMCKYQDDCNFGFQYELATENMNILADALRKTEPTISKMEQVEDEPQTDEEYINNLPWTEVGNGEQTENLFTDKDGDVWEWRGDAWYCISGDEPQTEKGGCTNCDGKDLCNNAFTEISQYCGAYEPQNGYQTFNGTSVYVSRFEDEPQTERSE